MIRGLTFLLGLILVSHYFTQLLVYLPLNLLDWLQSVLNFVLLVILAALIIWLMGD